ncbi:transposable element Tcb2 transposase [Trichonephila clavipes]|nr:transposable element Tcb2 transposase [Trichonephila clavipes]
MQRDCALRIADRGRLTSFFVEYKKGNQSLFECTESITKAEVGMPLHRFRKQYEQLSHFEKGRIIGPMEAGWSARRVARQLGHSDCVVRMCWDHLVREMSFTRRPGPGCSRQTSHREDSHIVRNAHVQPTASSAAIQAQVAPSLWSSQTMRRRLAEENL